MGHHAVHLRRHVRVVDPHDAPAVKQGPDLLVERDDLRQLLGLLRSDGGQVPLDAKVTEQRCRGPEGQAQLSISTPGWRCLSSSSSRYSEGLQPHPGAALVTGIHKVAVVVPFEVGDVVIGQQGVESL